MSNARAAEGGTLRFKATLSHASGKIYWSTAAGESPNAAAFSGPNQDLPIQKEREGVSVSAGEAHIIEITNCRP